jgi:hypothetical protein
VLRGQLRGRQFAPKRLKSNSRLEICAVSLPIDRHRVRPCLGEPSLGSCPIFGDHLIHHYVEEVRARVDTSDVTRVAVDETAARRGHDYISLFVDIDEARVIHVTEGKDAATVAAFAEDLTAHGGDPDQIAEVCIDISPAFIEGVAEHLPNAEVTFDKFHIVKIINDAVDEVRRTERKTHAELKATRYIWLRNPDTLSERQRAMLEALPTRTLRTARAYQIRLAFQDMYAVADVEAATAYLKNIAGKLDLRLPVWKSLPPTPNSEEPVFL